MARSEAEGGCRGVSVQRIRAKYIGDKRLSVVRRMGGVHREIAELFQEIAMLKDQKRCLGMSLDPFLNLKMSPMEIMAMQEEMRRIKGICAEAEGYKRRVEEEAREAMDALDSVYSEYNLPYSAYSRLADAIQSIGGPVEAGGQDEGRKNQCAKV